MGFWIKCQDLVVHWCGWGKYHSVFRNLIGYSNIPLIIMMQIHEKIYEYNQHQNVLVSTLDCASKLDGVDRR